jgi:hypothetical protein
VPPVTVACAHPLACAPVEVAAVITSLPDGVGTVALKAPFASAIVATTAVVLAGEPD